ncbi:MAG: homocysteine S-methyltransferase family protein [Spirochaetes bacterium]|nr:homocysteine S-methyltransferase family protein [Spirochaetota bacterium]
MTVKEFYKILQQKILILDGATGTQLQKRGMPKGVCPEQWVVDNPDVLIDIQREYKQSGSDVVYTCTLGATSLKLEEFGLENKAYELNKRLAQISREAMGNDGYVAGDMAPTGKFIEPFGDIPFEKAVDTYKEQATGLLHGGVDFFVIETMIDIQEMRAAIIAIKEVCDLPIIACLTYSEDGFTLTGTDPISALITLQSLGAHAVGCNCSTGPDAMVKIIQKIKPYSKVPLIAKPNAGLPKLINGETIFDMGAEEYSKHIPAFLDAGVNLIGGCCGTSFEYIRLIAEQAKNFKPILPSIKSISALSSVRNYVLPESGKPLNIVGERINPTGKKKLQAELKDGKFDEVKRFTIEQAQSGASILDVNMGMAGINEKEMMVKVVKLLSTISILPLTIDSSDPEVIEAALRIYPGRALINSISAEVKKIKHLLPIAAKYGAMFILLPLNDKTIPATAHERKEIVKEVFAEAEKYGYTKEDIVVDGLVMTVSSDEMAAKETLKLIKWCSDEFKVNTIIGLSNVSFGLPQRKHINASFLSMAIANGLSMAIANPCEEILINAKLASDVLTGNDHGSKIYIKHFSNIIKEEKKEDKKKRSFQELVYECVIDGEKDKIIDLVKNALDTGINSNTLVDDYLINAINKVGELYEKKIYFLPQLIASAETMKKAFDYLDPLLSKDEGSKSQKKVKIILATVKGDIHDIGKNIVGLMLKNYGFEVIDLGKDVSAKEIIDMTKNKNAQIIGLSALMTTTMVEMKKVILLVKENKLDVKIMIGGAVITQQYADEINADAYAANGIEAVKSVKRLIGIEL